MSDKMREVLLRLADACDAVGVQRFDTDTMSTDVAEMQAATQAARQVLALAEQPAPMSELIKKAGDLRDYLFIAEHHEEADTVATLLAEVERLTSDRRTLQEAGEHPAPCARHCESTAYEIELRQLRTRAEAAEARLRELAEAEPVAGVVLRDGQPTLVSKRRLIVDGDVALIRRPEMPS